MASHSFGLKNSEDKLKALIIQYEDFLEDDTSKIKADSLSSYAWHLTDWVFNEFYYTGSKSDTKRYNTELGIFRGSLYPRCPSLKIMHDIANSVKHSEVTRPKATIKDTREHEESFDDSFSREFDVSSLEIELEDGTVLEYLDEIEKVVNFWKDYFKNDLGKG